MSTQGLLRRRTVAAYALRNIVFTRRGASDRSAARLQQGLLALAAGMPYQPLVDLARQVGEHIVEDMHSMARQLVAGHVAAGDFCVLVSASPQELVSEVAVRLGAHRGVGTVAEVVAGHLTGRVEGAFCYGEGKLQRLREELGDVDLSRASGYADSASDVPLLRSCGRAMAVNPDRRLRLVAKDADWPVLRWRSGRRTSRR